MDLVEIGWTGKSHGLRGEIKLRVQEFYEDDLMEAKSVLIGDPPVPHFLEYVRGEGSIIAKLEGLDSREAIQLLSNQPLWLLAHQVSDREMEPDTPYDALIGFTIVAEGYPPLGPIDAIIDYPQHYLAELDHEGKTILIPLHEDLITGLNESEQILEMDLPGGLLDLGKE